MAAKRKVRSTKVKELHRRRIDAGHAENVRGGYIGETEKSKVASSRFGCDAGSKDPA